jgi:hypothetical protein
MKTLVIAVAAAVTLTGTAAFGDDNITTRTTVLPPVDATSVEGGTIDLSGSAAIDATGLPVGAALGIGPASVHGRVPAGTQPPAVGSGAVSNDD